MDAAKIYPESISTDEVHPWAFAAKQYGYKAILLYLLSIIFGMPEYVIYI